MRSYKKKSNKISKGYRLEPSTHKLIIDICRILKADQNEVLTLACRNYYIQINGNKAESNKINSMNFNNKNKTN